MNVSHFFTVYIERRSQKDLEMAIKCRVREDRDVDKISCSSTQDKGTIPLLQFLSSEASGHWGTVSHLAFIGIQLPSSHIHSPCWHSIIHQCPQLLFLLHISYDIDIVSYIYFLKQIVVSWLVMVKNIITQVNNYFYSNNYQN